MNNSPLANSIRSFWTPETSTNPEFLRLVREDKIVVGLLLGVPALVIIGLVIVVVALVSGTPN